MAAQRWRLDGQVALVTGASAGLGQGVFAVDVTLGSVYVQQSNVAVQRVLTTNTTL